MDPECLDENTLSELACSTLANEALPPALSHLEDCVECRYVLAELLQPERLRAPSWELPAGERLGRYFVLRRLGVGGMGTVYAAYDPALGRKVALKILHVRTSDSENETEDGEQLLREAQAMARLEHPNVLAVHDIGVYGGHVYLAMDFIEGESLRDFLAKEDRPLTIILDAFVAAGAGLLAAHQAGLVHCDFKPDNVLRSCDGRILVTDFGLAEVLARSEKKADVPQPSPPGALRGSLPYLSPELLRGEAATPGCDAWSFCIALYEAIYGRRPFSGQTRNGQLAAIFCGLAPPPSRTVSGRKVPGWLRVLLMRGLSARPVERFGSMAALLSALSRKMSRRLGRWLAILFIPFLLFSGIATFRWIALRPLRACENELSRTLKLASAGSNAGLTVEGASPLHQALAAYKDGWLAAARTSCQDTFLRRSQSLATQALRARCFAQQLVELAAIIEVLAQPPPTAQNATAAATTLANTLVQAAEALPNPERCSVKRVLSARPPLSAAGCAPGTCDRVPRLLARARVEQRLLMLDNKESRKENVAALLDQAHRIAASAGDEALGAEARLEEGLFLRTQKAQAAQGLRTLKEALWAAERARDDALTARAFVALMVALAADARPETAAQLRLFFPHARAAVLRIGGDAELSATLDRITPQ